MKRVMTTIAVLFLAVSVFAAAVSEKKAEGSGIKEVRVGTTALIERAVQGEYAFDMLASGVSEMPLVRQDSNGSFHPLVASYATEDARTWTYTVVDGLKWSDGTEVTALDILFTLEYEDSNGSANLISQVDSNGKETKSRYEAYSISEDQRSISLTLRAANVRELTNMTSLRIVPKHLYEDGDVTVEDSRVSCGPYVLESFDSASGTIVFKVNENYPKRPNVEKVVYQIFGNEDTMYMALLNGDIDFTFIYSSGVGATYLDVLETGKNLSILSYSAANEPLVLAFNNSTGPFADENLRHAIANAVDYQQMAAYVGGKTAKVANKGFVPEATVGYKETERLSTDLEKATSFMADAGYQKDSSGRFVDKDGKPFSFSVTYRLDRPAQVAGAELLKTQLEAFGITVELEGLDSASYNAKTSNKFSDNNVSFQAALFGYTSAGMGMMNGLGTIYVDKYHSVQGGCQVDDEQFAAALGKMASAANIEQYYEGAYEMQDFYAQRTPLVALYWDSMSFAVSSGYEGYVIDNVFGLNNIETWFSIKEV